VELDEIKNTKSTALRAKQIAGPNGLLPIALSTWWAGVKSGRYPKPRKLGPRVTVWMREEVMALLDLQPGNDNQ
jgi:prophage regulatory protein